MKKIKFLMTSMLVVVMMISLNINTTMAASGLKVHWINGGSGDAIYIECNGMNMLIDGAYYDDYHRDYNGKTGKYYGTYQSSKDKYFYGDDYGETKYLLPGNELYDQSISSYIKSDYNNIKDALIKRYDANVDGIKQSSLVVKTDNSINAYLGYEDVLKVEESTFNATKEVNDKINLDTLKQDDSDEGKEVIHQYQLHKRYKWYFIENEKEAEITDAYKNNHFDKLVVNDDTLSYKTKDAGSYEFKVVPTYTYEYVKTIDASDQTKVICTIAKEEDIPQVSKDETYVQPMILESKSQSFNIISSKYNLNETKYNTQMGFIKSEMSKTDNAVTRYLDSIGVKHINYIINSHPHQDHVGGLIPVISKYSYDQIYGCGYNYYSR